MVSQGLGEGGSVSTLVVGQDDPKGAIIEALRKRPYRPLELLELLEQILSDAVIKDAVSELLAEKKVELSPDRHLKLRTP